MPEPVVPYTADSTVITADSTTITVDETGEGNLVGVVLCSSVVSGTLLINIASAGNIVCSSVVSGTLTAVGVLSGSIEGSSSVVVNGIYSLVHISGEVSCSSLVSGDLVHIVIPPVIPPIVIIHGYIIWARIRSIIINKNIRTR